MKKLMLSFVFLSKIATAQVVSDFEKVPEYMKDGTITVELKNGKKYVFSTNEWKVVKRGVKTPQTVDSGDVANKTKTESRNRVHLHAGVGYKGFNTAINPSDILVKEKRVPVFGLSYFRLVEDDTSVGASMFTNGVFTLGVGKDF